MVSIGTSVMPYSGPGTGFVPSLMYVGLEHCCWVRYWTAESTNDGSSPSWASEAREFVPSLMYGWLENCCLGRGWGKALRKRNYDSSPSWASEATEFVSLM